MKWKNWIRHVVRNEELLKVVLECWVRETKGRPKLGMIDYLMEGTYAVNEEEHGRPREMENISAKDLPIERELMTIIFQMCFKSRSIPPAVHVFQCIPTLY